MNNLFKVFSALFISCLLTVSFTACSDDDSDDDGKVDDLKKIENFSVTIVQENIRDTYQYSWEDINGAYRYQVFYREAGSSEKWMTTNSYMSPRTPGKIITDTMMASYGGEVAYEMKIVAYRDSFDKIIAESDIIVSEPLSRQW